MRTTWSEDQRKFFTYLLTPSVILLTLITILPMLFLAATSFTSWDLSLPGTLKFTGLRNYQRIFFEDERFWNAVTVQVKLTFLTVPFEILLGLALATFVREKIKVRWLIDISRSIFIIPMVIPPVVAALIWKIIFTPPVSIISYISEHTLGLGPLDWLGDAKLALIAIAIASVWEFFPFCFLLIYAGLLSLPEEPFEAAKVDGASDWQIFRLVTLPLLIPVLSIVFLFRLVDSIRAFPLIFIMTQGGPGFATEPPNYYAYLTAFSFTYVGYSSAIIVVILSFTMLLTAAILRRIPWHRGAVS